MLVSPSLCCLVRTEYTSVEFYFNWYSAGSLIHFLFYNLCLLGDITLVLKLSNFIQTNLSVVLTWTINGIDMKYIKQAIVKCSLNDTENTNCGFNS